MDGNGLNETLERMLMVDGEQTSSIDKEKDTKDWTFPRSLVMLASRCHIPPT